MRTTGRFLGWLAIILPTLILLLGVSVIPGPGNRLMFLGEVLAIAPPILGLWTISNILGLCVLLLVRPRHVTAAKHERTFNRRTAILAGLAIALMLTAAAWPRVYSLIKPAAVQTPAR